MADSHRQRRKRQEARQGGVVPVSLGYRCETAYQLREYFGVDQAMPFDWLITPLSAIPLMVRENFRRIADGTVLEPIEYRHNGRDVQTVLNTYYGVVLRHEFHETPDLRLLPDWRTEIPSVAEKWTFLASRWRRVMQEASLVVFARRSGNITVPHGEPRATACADFQAVFETLRAEAPRSTFVVGDPGCDLGPYVTTGEIGAAGPEHWTSELDSWKGPTDRWRSLLARALPT